MTKLLQLKKVNIYFRHPFAQLPISSPIAWCMRLAVSIVGTYRLRVRDFLVIFELIKHLTDVMTQAGLKKGLTDTNISRNLNVFLKMGHSQHLFLSFRFFCCTIGI